MTHKTLLVLLFCSLSAIKAISCTTAIISGKYTQDGRPILFKQRDSEGATNNVWVYSNSGKYEYLGVVPIRDKSGKRVVYGHNEMGLAIINSNAYNLDGPSTNNETAHNLIRKGLESCADVDDFERLLKSVGAISYGSNYGCIDANGGCCYFECGKNGVHKYDANDSVQAPKGYIIRTNFGFSSDISKGKGYSRYMMTEELFDKYSKKGKFDWKSISTFSRILKHGLTHMDLNDWMPESETDESYYAFRDFIPRYSTASTVVVQGVRKGESPYLTTEWTAISNPLTTVFIPIWFTHEHKLPQCVQRNAQGFCSLVNWGMAFKKYLFPMNNIEGHDYIMLSRLINQQQSGVLQQITAIEDTILTKADSIMGQSYIKGKLDKGYSEYYDWIDGYIETEYTKLAHKHGLLK